VSSSLSTLLDRQKRIISLKVLSGKTWVFCFDSLDDAVVREIDDGLCFKSVPCNLLFSSVDGFYFHKARESRVVL
jgi:hypothetical protein